LTVNKYIVRGALVGALGGLLFGFDTAVISGATVSLTRAYGLTASQLGLTVSIALLGTIVGALGSGVLGQRYGAREVLRLTALLYLLSALGCAFAPSWGFLLASRLLGGLGIGGSSVLSPVYIAEIAPPRLRGRLVGTFQINIVAGILLAYLSNFLIGLLHLGLAEWRWEFGVAALPAAIFLGLLFIIPHSARWLALQGRLEEARDVLALLGTPNPQAELDEIRASLHEQVNVKGAALFEFRKGGLRYGKPIFLAIAIAAFNQLTGINAVLYYLNDIFAAAGFSQISGSLQAVAIGAMNLVATVVGMALIDRLGRKKLLLVGSVGTASCLSCVAAIFLLKQHQDLLVWALVAYIAFFAVSQGAVIWVYISEVFPTRVRGKGQSLGAGTHWTMNAIISLIFPVVAARSGAYPFIFFAAMMVLQFFVVLFFFPETKQVSLEELQRKLQID